MANPPLPPPPVRVRHAEYSMLFSADDDAGQPNAYLIDLALQAAAQAAQISLQEVSVRLALPPYYPEVWPGEHYRLLAALVKILRPKLVIEIGTATGLSALALKQYLPGDGRIVTYDVIPWQHFPGSALRLQDFADGRLQQRTDDLSRREVFEAQRAELRGAQLIFVDAAKDGAMEQRFLDHFALADFAQPPLIVFDDIRLWNMLAIWRGITKPKLDLTSFGHWSGTGLVQWST